MLMARNPVFFLSTNLQLTIANSAFMWSWLNFIQFNDITSHENGPVLIRPTVNIYWERIDPESVVLDQCTDLLVLHFLMCRNKPKRVEFNTLHSGQKACRLNSRNLQGGLGTSMLFCFEDISYNKIASFCCRLRIWEDQERITLHHRYVLRAYLSYQHLTRSYPYFISLQHFTCTSRTVKHKSILSLIKN